MIAQPFHQLDIPSLLHSAVNPPPARIPMIRINVFHNADLRVTATRAAFCASMTDEVTFSDPQTGKSPVHVKSEGHVNVPRLIGIKCVSLLCVHEQVGIGEGLNNAVVGTDDMRLGWSTRDLENRFRSPLLARYEPGD